MNDMKFTTAGDYMKDLDLNMLTRNKLIETLKTGVCTITFKKVDGSERVMKGTLAASMLPEQKDVEEIIQEAPPRKENQDVVAVYDVEKEGWRSFRIENITDFTSP